MKELIRDKDTQIMEMKKELEVLNSCCLCKNFPIVRDTPVVQDDTMSSGEAARSLLSKSNQPEFSDAATDNVHVSKIL
jgi:kinesin family member 18/19